ncbi:MAG: YebC/PmpR family DNA-binding transcriptional regulator [Ruminococcaceae bacterium]|nr:YebC/PmpR family DNA-binding transcriptional regulator [Oscillospiraceae bacterium]
MSGHSKWKNIMHKKEKTDAQRAKIFTKIGKEMSIAIREGGADPNSNGKLRELIVKAKANNVPNDNIERILKKFSGDNSVVYDEISYEGYGPGGVAIIVSCATDNKNRTGPEVRHYFDKYGGNLGTNGCVSYLFSDQGVIIVAEEDVSDEDALMETALEAGASDFENMDGCFQITTDYADLYTVRDAIEAAGYKITSAEHDKIPSMYVTLENEEQIKQMNTLLEMLEDNDDVQDVYHNWENADE